MAKKNDGLTPRQRQSQQIMREKAAKKKREALHRKIFIFGGGGLAVIMLGSGLLMWKTGTFGRIAQNTVNTAYGVTAKAGFAVRSLSLEGRNRTSMSDIEKALGVKKGDAILQLSLSDIRERLEKIESVHFAAVERSLPGTLHIRISEREPVARWQQQGKVALVDDQGMVMNGLDITPYRQLPLIIGDDAPKHVDEVLALLASEKELGKRFQVATRIGDRRWNIRLAGNVDVKLPENNPAEAWKKLAELQSREQVLDRDVKMIDLRVQGRLFIKLIPQDAVDKTTGAKET